MKENYVIWGLAGSLLFGLLGGLGTELHQNVYQSVRADGKDDNNGRIPPAIVVLLQVEGSEVILTLGVRAHLALRRRIWVDEVADHAQALVEVVLQILAAGRSVGWVETRKLLFGALNVGAPDVKDKHAAHEVVEGVEPVHPVPPECLDLLVRHQHTTERDKGTQEEGLTKEAKTSLGA